MSSGLIAFLPDSWPRRIVYFSFVGALIALPTSPALLSIFTVGMILPSFFTAPVKVQLQRFYACKPAFYLSLIIPVILLSFFWTADYNYSTWLGMIRVQIPLFFVLYALTVSGPFSTDQIRVGLLGFLLGVMINGGGSVLYYFLNQEEINALIKISKPIPVLLDVNHIYLSIMMAFSIFAGIWLFRFRSPLFFKGERWVIAGLTASVFFFLHVLTTRTGLLSFYGTTGVLGLVALLRRKRYLMAGGLILLLLSLPVAGYYLVPSLQNRVDNTINDIDWYLKGNDPNNLSIGTRMEAIKTAWHIIEANPLIGVGAADLDQEMIEQYVTDDTLLCPENFEMPHHQFVQYLAGLGLLGLLVFSFGWFYPLFARGVRMGFLFQAFWWVFFLGMQVESPVQRQAGVLLLSVMWMVGIWSSVDRD